MGEAELTRETPIYTLEMRERKYDESECNHSAVYVSEMEWKIVCKKCEKEIDPIAYLVMVARESRHIKWQLGELQKELNATRNKLRCKCERCGEMTKINR